MDITNRIERWERDLRKGEQELRRLYLRGYCEYWALKNKKRRKGAGVDGGMGLI